MSCIHFCVSELNMSSGRLPVLNSDFYPKENLNFFNKCPTAYTATHTQKKLRTFFVLTDTIGGSTCVQRVSETADLRVRYEEHDDNIVIYWMFSSHRRWLLTPLVLCISTDLTHYDKVCLFMNNGRLHEHCRYCRNANATTTKIERGKVIRIHGEWWRRCVCDGRKRKGREPRWGTFPL